MAHSGSVIENRPSAAGDLASRSDDLVRLLLARAARRSVAPHGDGARVALVVEGGAMRGVVSAGMVSALEALDCATAFDAVYGSSAGAINAAYFLAGQAALGTTIYHEDINTRAFIDWRRPLRGRPIVDLGFLLDDVILSRKPLDATRVLQSTSPLAVIATEVTTGDRAVFRKFRDGAALRHALRASSTMPVVAGDPIEYAGRRYLDASLSEPIPLPTAEADGHTHVLVLLTRPVEVRHTLSWFDRWYVLPRLRRLSPVLARRYADRFGPYAALLRRIDGAEAVRDGGPIIVGLRPPGPAVSKLERRREVLVAGARAGYDEVIRMFAARSRRRPDSP